MDLVSISELDPHREWLKEQIDRLHLILTKPQSLAAWMLLLRTTKPNEAERRRILREIKKRSKPRNRFWRTRPRTASKWQRLRWRKNLFKLTEEEVKWLFTRPSVRMGDQVWAKDPRKPRTIDNVVMKKDGVVVYDPALDPKARCKFPILEGK